MVRRDRLSGADRRIGNAARWLASVMLLVALALAAFETPAQAGPLITDGTFVSTSLNSPGGYLCGNGPNNTCLSNLTYWSGTCAPGHACGSGSTPGSLLFPGTNGSAWNGGLGLDGTITNPPLGGNIVALDGDSTYRSSIYQTVTGLIAGDEYVLTFYQAAAQQKGASSATTEQWQVTLGSQTLTGALMNNSAGGFVPWQQQTLDFTATASSEVLTFLSLGGPTGTPPVDLLADVSMTLPEPASLAMLAGGLLALTAVRRRRKGNASF